MIIFLRPNLVKKIVIKFFHILYYRSPKKTWSNTSWLGIPLLKCPLDLWIYQEILFDIKPDIIIETGTHLGGNALFLASICDLINKGTIITIDTNNELPTPQHKRIRYIRGSSVSDEVVRQVKQFIKTGDRVIVNLDSDHTKAHVLQELLIYSKFVSPGSYIIVEDTNIGGHPVKSNCYPGPMEAVKQFLKITSDFSIDKDREKFFLTFNPNGYLQKHSI